MRASRRSRRIIHKEVKEWVGYVHTATDSVQSEAVKSLNEYVFRCRSAGIWNKLRSGVLLPMCSNTVNGVFSTLCAPLGTTFTPNSIVSSDYTLTTGLDLGSSNTTKFVTTNIAPEQIFTSTSVHVSGWQRIMRATQTNTLFNCGGASASSRIMFHTPYQSIDYWDTFNDSSARISAAVTTAGLVTGSRTASESVIYRNGVPTVSSSATGGTFPAGSTVTLFRLPSLSFFDCQSWGMLYFGPSLTRSEEFLHFNFCSIFQRSLRR